MARSSVRLSRAVCNRPWMRPVDSVCAHLILVLGDIGVDLMQGAHAVELAQV